LGKSSAADCSNYSGFMIDTHNILSVLKHVVEPSSGRDIVRLSWIRNLKVSEDAISFMLLLSDPTLPFAGVVKSECEKALRAAYPNVRLSIEQDSPMIGLGDDFQIDGNRTSIGGRAVANSLTFPKFDKEYKSGVLLEVSVGGRLELKIPEILKD